MLFIEILQGLLLYCCLFFRMRSGQKPLKIECFEIKDPGKREKIGYVLLSLRSALIVAPRDEDTDIAATWHRLSGLRNDVKTDKPEISLALTIEEHDTYVRRMSRQEVIDVLIYSVCKTRITFLIRNCITIIIFRISTNSCKHYLHSRIETVALVCTRKVEE